ncbi:type II toxin-antitoxin system VapC family toxin [Desulfonema limicola]|uniref:type II toxin-antitoxin system VapC family toxin n=1 Tax=Desulfonema limicola TaxID=45656 RepID=UPI003B8376A8
MKHNTLTVAHIHREILIEAAEIRSKTTQIRLPDAIHLATAKYHKCLTFLTNDKQLRNLPYIKVVLIDEIKAF